MNGTTRRPASSTTSPPEHRQPVVHRRRLPRPAQQMKLNPNFLQTSIRSSWRPEFEFYIEAAATPMTAERVPHLPDQHRRDAAHQGAGRPEAPAGADAACGRRHHLGRRLPRRADPGRSAAAQDEPPAVEHHAPSRQLHGRHQRRLPRRAGGPVHHRRQRPADLLHPGRAVVRQHTPRPSARPRRRRSASSTCTCRNPTHYESFIIQVNPDGLLAANDPDSAVLSPTTGSSRSPRPEPDRLLRPRQPRHAAAASS